MSENLNFKPQVGWEVIAENPQVLETGDIIHVQGKGLLSFLIRMCSQGLSEPRTWASHSAMVLLVDNNGVEIIEATKKVGKRPFRVYKGKTSRLVISRKQGRLDDETKQAIIVKSEYYHGLKYGVGKIILHFLDYIFGGIYLFRRLAVDNRYPICSWIVAFVYDRVLNYRFGVAPNAAQPDDISDFCVKDNWDFIWADSSESMEDFRRAYHIRETRRLDKTNR